jgi:hypothetical protein
MVRISRRDKTLPVKSGQNSLSGPDPTHVKTRDQNHLIESRPQPPMAPIGSIAIRPRAAHVLGAGGKLIRACLAGAAP